MPDIPQNEKPLGFAEIVLMVTICAVTLLAIVQLFGSEFVNLFSQLSYRF